MNLEYNFRSMSKEEQMAFFVKNEDCVHSASRQVIVFDFNEMKKDELSELCVELIKSQKE